MENTSVTLRGVDATNVGRRLPNTSVSTAKEREGNMTDYSFPIDELRDLVNTAKKLALIKNPALQFEAEVAGIQIYSSKYCPPDRVFIVDRQEVDRILLLPEVDFRL
jgi:hypothetical protein